MNIYRDGTGTITNSRRQPWSPSWYSLAPGLQTTDATKPGIGFCYNQEDGKLYEVTGNDDQNYHPFCYVSIRV